MKSALDSLIEELETEDWQASKTSQAEQVKEPNWQPPLDPARERETQIRPKLWGL